MTMRNDRVPSDAVAVTPSDTTQVNLCGFYVGSAGDVTVVGAPETTAVLFKACPLGTIIMMTITRIMSTGTASTSITGFVP